MADDPLKEQRTVLLTRLLEWQSRRRRAPKEKRQVQVTNHLERPAMRRRMTDQFDQNDHLRKFLWDSETTQILTVEEESELIVMMQGFIKLQEVKHRLQTEFAREPTLVEWAKAAGFTSQELQSQLHSGKRSREKLINSNLRMVVHIAKKYQGLGLSLQDLLPAGSVGLMRSIEKFKPNAGCRFPSYAYWWIRQAVRKAIFRDSRAIRLPVNAYQLLFKVYEAKKFLKKHGNHFPTEEEIASRVGISVEKLQVLLSSTRLPTSLQRKPWEGDNATWQEVIADTAIDEPLVSVSKEFMRQNVRNLLNVLSPKEKKIIQLRFGFGGGREMTLAEIGLVFGLSKERVRQLESRAFNKLKQSFDSRGVDGYIELLH